MNRTVIFKDIDPKINSDLMNKKLGHIKFSGDINRFHDSYLPFSSCKIVQPNTVDIINVLLLLLLLLLDFFKNQVAKF